MNMHTQPIKADWSKMKSAERIGAIVSVYGKDYNTARMIALALSDRFGATVTKNSVMSIYRCHFDKPESPLKKCPLLGNQTKVLSNEEMIIAENLWRQGMSGTSIARRLGVGMRQIYTFAETRRDKFPRRTAKIASPGIVVMTIDRDGATIPMQRQDRVSRITFSGARVTMPRVTFIDGPAA